MPRHSPYPVVLSPPERAALTVRATQYTRPFFEVRRAQMILLAAEGWPNATIADRVQTSREVVSLWRKRFYDERLVPWKRINLYKYPDRDLVRTWPRSDVPKLRWL